MSYALSELKNHNEIENQQKKGLQERVCHPISFFGVSLLQAQNGTLSKEIPVYILYAFHTATMFEGLTVNVHNSDQSLVQISET